MYLYDPYYPDALCFPSICNLTLFVKIGCCCKRELERVSKCVPSRDDSRGDSKGDGEGEHQAEMVFEPMNVAE